MYVRVVGHMWPVQQVMLRVSFDLSSKSELASLNYRSSMMCLSHIILSFSCSCRADDGGLMIDDDPFLIVAAAAYLLTDKIVGSAIPFADELEHYKLSWHLSNGCTLVISRPFHDDHDWEQNLEFTLTGFSTSLVSWCHEIA